MLNLIIKNFLSQHTKIVVPNFGVFIKKEDSQEVIFTQLLKKDDGVLVDLVMSHFTVEKPVAQEFINKYIGQIKQQVLVGDSYLMPQFGELTLSDSGNFTFKHTPGTTLEDLSQKTDSQEELIEQNSPNYPIEKKGKDKVLIIAVIAALLAILVMVYGLIFSVPNDVDLTPQLTPQTTPQTTIEQSITE